MGPFYDRVWDFVLATGGPDRLLQRFIALETSALVTSEYSIPLAGPLLGGGALGCHLLPLVGIRPGEAPRTSLQTLLGH